MPINIGYIIGSLSKDSINRKLTDNLLELANNNLKFSEINISHLPLYNRDNDTDFPPQAREFKEKIETSDALLFVTPEYNRTLPAALKNALEWGSRPFGQNAFAHKPAGVIGASPGNPGTSMSQQHLRNVLSYLNVPTLNQPEAFIQFTPQRFADDGTAQDDATREVLQNWLSAYYDWTKRFVEH